MEEALSALQTTTDQNSFQTVHLSQRTSQFRVRTDFQSRFVKIPFNLDARLGADNSQAFVAIPLNCYACRPQQSQVNNFDNGPNHG